MGQSIAILSDFRRSFIVFSTFRVMGYNCGFSGNQRQTGLSIALLVVLAPTISEKIKSETSAPSITTRPRCRGQRGKTHEAGLTGCVEMWFYSCNPIRSILSWGQDATVTKQSGLLWEQIADEISVICRGGFSGEDRGRVAHAATF